MSKELVSGLATFTPPPGWFGASPNTIAPCPQTPPGPNPYLPWTNPLDGLPYYFRFDGAVRPRTNQVDGHFAGEGGSDHTLMYLLDGMEIPIRSGAQGADGWPIFIYPAPYRNATIEGHPTETLCSKYAQQNGPRAKQCPSGQTAVLYSNSIKSTPQWTSGNAARNAQIAAQCHAIPPDPDPAPNPYAPWIEELYREGITAGCQVAPPGGKPSFCPEATVTRAEMAVFLLRAIHGANYVPPACTGIFADVGCEFPA